MPVLLYAHLTWTTRERAELIDVAGAAFLQRFLPAAARRLGVDVLETGIVRDHVHVLLRLEARLDIPRLVQGLKGASARIANRDRVMGKTVLRWAEGYDLRSVSPKDLLRVEAYVRRQAERHPAAAIDAQPRP